MKKVKELMIREHAVIKEILEKIEGIVDGDDEGKKKLFDEFEILLENHFYLEENAIFDLYKNITGEEVNDIFDLLKEHGEIMEIVRSVERGMADGVGMKFDKLKEMLTKHAEFEDKVFYPRLDQELSREHKQRIIDKVEEIMASVKVK